MKRFVFETVERTSTEYIVGHGALNGHHVHDVLSDKPYAVLLDAGVAAAHPKIISTLPRAEQLLGTLSLPGGEAVKSIEALTNILTFFQKCSLPKHGVVLSIGGGAVCDVAALAAMLIRRGVELVMIPTTVVAQVDAAVGGKNGINFGSSKNAIGNFHQPSLVCCDQEFLVTLDDRQMACGMAELIKVLAVSSRGTFERHFPMNAPQQNRAYSQHNWTEIVWDALTSKLELLKEDPFEKSSRRLLNYGHAFAHFLEERSNFVLLHGEAVLMGMIIENEISRELGIGSDIDMNRMNELIAHYLTPACVKWLVPFDEVIPDIAKLRQVRRGSTNFVCVSNPGKAEIVDDVSLESLGSAWTRAEQYLVGTRHFSAESSKQLSTPGSGAR